MEKSLDSSFDFENVESAFAELLAGNQGMVTGADEAQEAQEEDM